MDRETSLQWFRVLTRHIYYDVWVTQMFQNFSRQDKSCVGGFHPSFKERGFSASHPYKYLHRINYTYFFSIAYCKSAYCLSPRMNLILPNYLTEFHIKYFSKRLRYSDTYLITAYVWYPLS